MTVEYPVILLLGEIALGAAFYPALKLPRWPRMALGVLLGVPMLLAPLLIAPEQRLDRFIMSVIGLTMFGKIMDAHVARKLGLPSDLRSYLLYLVHPFSMVQRRLDREPKHDAAENVKRFVRGALLAIIGAGASWWWVDQLEFIPAWFFIEHALKTTTALIGIYGAATALAALWRLAGGRTREPFHNFFAARTPAEFWRRYNRLVGQFFHENLFKQLATPGSRNRRSPIAAILGVFAMSGLAHEYVFGIATGRFQGVQMIFFMVSGVAVAATMHIKPSRLGGRRAIAWMIATFVFMLMLSMLFFASWNQIGPHYSNAAPAWMRSP